MYIDLGGDEMGRLTKLAALKEEIELYPHQRRVVEKESPAVIAAHAVGSGKTLTAIARFEKLKSEGKAKKALVVAPAGLRDNFGEHGVKKFTDSTYNIIGNKQEVGKGGAYSSPRADTDYNIISYEMFRKDPERYLSETGADTVILDEQHRGKNEGTMTTDALKKIKGKYQNFIGLTGSLVSNSIADVQPLVDVASGGEHLLGKTKDEFSQKYLLRDSRPPYNTLHEKRRPIIGFKNKTQMLDEIGDYVDYVGYDDIKALANIPEKRVNVIKVPLSDEQAKLYKKILNQDPAAKRLILKKRLETLRDEEAAQAFSTLIESRKLMNNYASVLPGMSIERGLMYSPKQAQLVRDMEEHLRNNPQGQALLFSHLIHGGVDSLEAALKHKHIPYGKFIGKGNDVTEEMRQQDVRDYLDRKKRVLIVSPAGGEGLSLNDTTWEGVLDPHYNPEKMNQMEARGIRSGGLAYLPKDDREVKVNRYIATMPKTFGFIPSRYRTPDEFIYEIAQNKDRQNHMLYNLLRQYQAKQNGGVTG